MSNLEELNMEFHTPTNSKRFKYGIPHKLHREKEEKFGF